MSKERRGDLIVTYTGRSFWPLDARPEEVDVRDVAHHLSLLNRFTGATRGGVSVAEHSCHVSDVLPPEFRLWGLLHDASEAYLGDIARPLKIHPEFAAYRVLEAQLMKVVCDRFGLAWPEPPEVKYADNSVGKAERIAQMAEFPPGAIDFDAEPADVEIHCWSPRRAEREFLRRFERLTGIEALLYQEAA